MRIALNHTRFQIRGGVERYLWTMARKLAERGNDVHLLCARCEEPCPSGLTFHRIPVFRLGQTAKAVSFARNSRETAMSGEFDIVQGFGKTIWGDVYRDGSGTCREYGRYLKKYEPSVLGSLGYSFSLKQSAFRHLERKRFHAGSYRKIAAISNMVKDQILSEYDMPEDMVRVIRPGIDTDRLDSRSVEERRSRTRESLSIKEDTPVILAVASGFTRKGITPLLEAMRHITEYQWKFLVAGHDRNLNEYREKTEKLGLKERVRFLGWREEVDDYFAAADVFVLNSRFDAFGNAAAEAMAAGLVCIISSRAGASEMISDGDNGLVIQNPDDSEEISSILKNVLDGKYSLNTMRESARQTAEENSMERNIEDYLRLYEEVLQEK